MSGYALNEKISGLTPYEPISGNFDIRLDANESFLDLPQNIRNAVDDCFASLKFNRYPDPCCKELIAAYAKMFSLSEQCITAGNGSDELISVIMAAFLMKGERVLNILPDFSMYAFYASISEDEVISLKKSDDFEIDIDEVINVANSQNVRMIIFSNPCNPTAKGLSREQVRYLINSVNALVVLDEAYMDFWDQSLLDEVENYDNLIILKTFSKAFGMAALRLGFAIACPKLTNVIRAVKSPYNVNSVTQAVACKVLEFPQEIKDAFNTIIASKEKLHNSLKELEERYPSRIEVMPSCTNFVVVKSREARQIFDYLLLQSIAVRFMGGFLRITAGSEEENSALVKNIKAYLEGEK